MMTGRRVHFMVMTSCVFLLGLFTNPVGGRTSLCKAESLLRLETKDCLKPISSMRRVFGEDFEHFALRLCDIQRKVNQCIADTYRGCPSGSLSRDPSYLKLVAEVEASRDECDQLAKQFSEERQKYRQRKPKTA